MQVAISVGGPDSGLHRDFERTANFAVEAEKLGVDQAWSAESWGFDAATTLAYLAARTTRMTLGTGILQITARTPSMTAMTALSLASLSGNRFVLGLGASGPQVVEGLHGESFRKPLARMREVIGILRQAFRGRPLKCEGEHYVLPRPGGEGKALRLAFPRNREIPIWLATLAPKGLELTGELADGWLGVCFTPEHAEAHLAHLRRGAEKAGRKLSDLTLCAGGAIAITDDPEPLIRGAKPFFAFMLGAMGSAKTNFYNDAYRRGGFEDEATEVQRLWLAGKRRDAARAVPDALVERSSFFGPESVVRERIRKYHELGVGVLRLVPAGETASDRLDTLGRAVELVREESNG
ncbi:MAG: LLM class flavin-dependent oxidoreductase [Myxococcota bacterium]|nr:LLM class flavin-dependent oxidoreductase [Myxococcota bacterium]